MIVIGNLGSDLVARTNSKTGKIFYTTRLAESFGRDENRNTQWFDVTANISAEEANLLRKGMLVKLVGRISSRLYNGSIILSLSAFSLTPYEPTRRQETP